MSTVKSDALITAADIDQIQHEVVRGEFQRLVFELLVREPELAVAISDRFNKITKMHEAALLTIKQRCDLSKQLALLVWLPVLLMDRANRRSWEDFLPSAEAIGGSDEEGGAE
ncbi:MAG TPA: hypothetical protein VIL86_16110 [Tepidisphaeraceae bacterium]|jgi:hypothetical protein